MAALLGVRTHVTFARAEAERNDKAFLASARNTLDVATISEILPSNARIDSSPDNLGEWRYLHVSPWLA